MNFEGSLVKMDSGLWTWTVWYMDPVHGVILCVGLFFVYFLALVDFVDWRNRIASTKTFTPNKDTEFFTYMIYTSFY
jgi:hypothetical protein